MTFRKIVTTVTPYSVLALPLWVVLGSGVFGRSGWKFLASLPIGAVMLVALGLLAMLTWGLRAHQPDHLLPLPEAYLWTILIVSGIGIGLFNTWFYTFIAAGMVAGLTLFGLAFWRIVANAKATVSNLSTPPAAQRQPDDIGNLTVIEVEATSTNADTKGN